MATNTVTQVAGLTMEEQAEYINAITKNDAPLDAARLEELERASAKIIAAQAKLDVKERKVGEQALEKAVSALSKSAGDGDEHAAEMMGKLGASAAEYNPYVANYAFVELNALKESKALGNKIKQTADSAIKRLEQPLFLKPLERLRVQPMGRVEPR